VKRTDVQGARYDEVEEVDPALTLSKFIARWVSKKRPELDPSLVTLRLVKCGAGVPDAALESASNLLSDPSMSLSDAGLAPTSWLLANFAGGAGVCTLSTARTARKLRARAHAAPRSRRCSRSPGVAWLPRCFLALRSIARR
jgi:hypothetical protein